MADLEGDIAGGRFLPVYILAGDAFLQNRVLEALREHVVPEALRGFNLDAFEARSASPTQVLNAARTLPMMGERRLVLVRECDAYSAQQLEEFLPYLEAPSAETVLALAFPKADGRLKFFQRARKLKLLQDLGAPRQLLPWLADEARRLGVRLDGRAARRLLDVVGKDLARLCIALEQLALYAAGQGSVTVDHVDDLIAETREESVFELTDAVGRADAERALRAVAKLHDQRQSSIGVTIMLARHFRQLWVCRELMEGRASTGEIRKRLGVPEFVVSKIMDQARRFPPERLGQAMQLLAQTDRDLKGPKKSALGERVLMERVVTSLVRLAG